MLSLQQSIRQIISPRMLMVYILGFVSGFPLAFTASTLQAWLTTSNVSLFSIGLLTLVGLPYSYKFIWAPLLDRYKIPLPLLTHKRKSWIVVFQLLLAGILLFLSKVQPEHHLLLIGIAGLCIATLSASMDVVIDAYRTEYLRDDERGMGAASFTFAYRLAMLVSGGAGLIYVDHHGWSSFFVLCALIMFVGAFIVCFLSNTKEQHDSSSSFIAFIVNPFRQFLTRKQALTILLFIACYKFAEGYILSLATTFFLSKIHLSLTQVGVLFKTVSFAGVIVGAYLGGVLLPKIGLYKSLMYFGIFQASTCLLYVLLAVVGHGYALTAVTVGLETMSSGMSTTALMVYFMSLCDKRYTGTQFAIFTAVMVIGRVVSGPIASVIVTNYGWAWMFFSGFIISFPALYFLRRLRPNI
jgi:MFS transporter, PAT family, beta-lactamase induction signal transducer AmpG